VLGEGGEEAEAEAEIVVSGDGEGDELMDAEGEEDD
jgi:hypothetical protein